LDVGALVSIRGAGRVKISRFLGVSFVDIQYVFVIFGLTQTLGDD